MSSTYSTRLRFEQQAAGENLNVWGPKVNASLLRLEEAIAGRQALTVSGSVTLTTANGTSDQSREMFLDCTGTGGTITIPTVEKVYMIRNATSGAVVVTTGSGTTSSIPSGDVNIVMTDGTNVYKGFISGNYLPLGGGTLTGALNGTTAAFSGAVSGSTGTFSGLVIGSVGFRTDGAAGSFRINYITSSNVLRWTYGATNDAESGSNNGTNFSLVGWDDAGSSPGNALLINRKTFATTLGGSLTTGGALSVPSGGATVVGGLTADSAAGTVRAAASDVNTGTSTSKLTTPASIAGSSLTAKAWVRFDSSGNITKAFNVSSVSKTATGKFTVNFTNAMSGVSYTTLCTSEASFVGTFGAVAASSQGTSSVGVYFANNSAVLDPTYGQVVVFD